MKKYGSLLFLLISFTSCSVFSGGNCKPYGDWVYQQNECRNTISCPQNWFKGTYKIYYREKQCKKGIVRQEKKEKVKCGC